MRRRKVSREVQYRMKREREYEEEEESETGVTPMKRLRQGGGQESQ